MATQNKTAACVFEFMNEEIRGGKGDVYLPQVDGLSAVVKRYVEGGENRLHCHPVEDHAFFVLQGEATFHVDAEENVVVVGANDAVMLPRGTYYRFLSSGDEKLLMLRVGNGLDDHARQERLDAEGIPFPEVLVPRGTYAPVKNPPF